MTKRKKRRTTQHQNPRILVVTPEVTFVRHGMGREARIISARSGGLGDICTAQIHIDLYARAHDRPLVELKAAPGLPDPSQIAA